MTHRSRARAHDGRLASEESGRNGRERAFGAGIAWVVAVALVVLFAAATALAQSSVPTPPGEEDRSRRSPRSAMRGFLLACREDAYGLAADYLVLDAAQRTEPSQVARELKRVLDRNLWVDLDALSDEPSGNLGDGDRGRDFVGRIAESGGDEIPIVLERSSADGTWRIAGSTVIEVGEMYARSGLGPLVDLLPEWSFVRVGELELWQWSALLLAVVLAYGFSVLAVSAAVRVALRIAARSQSAMDDELIRCAAAPLVAAVSVCFFLAATLPLGLPVPAQAFLRDLAQVLVVVALTWLAVRAIEVAARVMEQRLGGRADTTLLTVIPVGRRVAKVCIAVIGGLAALQNVGVNVVSIIAGLGIAGIAVALAAQKTFENFFGTLSILIDQPIRRGDFCRFGEKLGTVEDIGLRSTRVRTLDRTLVTIPNSEFSSMQIENFGSRDRIRFSALLGLRYETSADQLRHVLIGLKRLLVAHPRVLPDPARIRLVGLGAYSLDLEVFAYVDTSDWDDFLAVREDLMLQIIQVIETSGTGFAFPSQTLYLGKDAGLDSERRGLAEADVRTWRESSELPLPDLPRVQLEKLRGTLIYPPPGSSTSKDG
jgi:MscS family membrane protein